MRKVVLCILLASLLSLSSICLASTSGPLTVKAVSGGKTATWTYNWVAGQSSYALTGPVELRAGDNTLLGTLSSLSCGMGSDPFLTLNFAVQAVGPTTFFFDTGEVFFGAIDPAAAFATAATTLTADGSGATFTGLFAGGKAYEATYNGGTVFADLDGPFSAPPDTSTTESERVPAVGFANIGVPVTSMRAQWNFSVTGGDGASGTSRFDIEPVPDASTLALAGAGMAPMLLGFAARRRRRA